MCLYESAMVRQGRAIRAAAAAWGGGSEDYEEPSYSARLRGEREKKEKTYLSPWLVDPEKGGEVTPTYGENEISVLPINLGYSIIEEESSGEDLV